MGGQSVHTECNYSAVRAKGNSQVKQTSTTDGQTQSRTARVAPVGQAIFRFKCACSARIGLVLSRILCHKSEIAVLYDMGSQSRHTEHN